MDNLQKEIKNLENSMVYVMSLGSMELFHSNIWAWLMNKHEKMKSIFFPNVSFCFGATREEGHRDITLYDTTGHYLVIENKIKSYATEDQLVRYMNIDKVSISKEVKENDGKNRVFGGGVLTGIVKPDFTLPNGWIFMSYMQIANAFLNYIKKNKSEFSSNELDILMEYISNVQSIDKIFNQILPDPNNLDVAKLKMFPSDFEELKTIRLHDIAKKLYANAFISYASKEIKELEKEIQKHNSDLYIQFFPQFHNNSASIEARIVRQTGAKQDIHKDQNLIGVEIERNQYRYVYQNKYSKSEAEKLFLKGAKLGWFDESFDRISNKYIFGKPTKFSPVSKLKKHGVVDDVGLKFNIYTDENKYVFIYQYVDIDETMTFKQLKDNLISDLKRISLNINQAI